MGEIFCRLGLIILPGKTDASARKGRKKGFDGSLFFVKRFVLSGERSKRSLIKNSVTFNKVHK